MPLTPVTPPRPLRWPDTIAILQATLAPQESLYLVGGVVRDAYLQRPIHDIDLATAQDGCQVARYIANAFNGSYYPLDHERGVGRAIITLANKPITVDVAQFRGDDLHTDLQHRDFTINAMAVDLNSDLQQVIDPTGGLVDLQQRVLRRCLPDAIASDPVRAIRAVRACTAFQLRLDPDTRADIHAHASQLQHASVERIRDEFFTILDGPRPHTALEMLRRLGLLDFIVAETGALPDTPQSPPHEHDVWHHTLSTIEHLDALLRVIAGPHDDNLTANIRLGTIPFVFGEFRSHLQTHLGHTWPNHRTHRALLILAALLHDCGKPDTLRRGKDDRIHFYGHETLGAQLAFERGTALRLSSDESTYLKALVTHHMRPLGLFNEPTVSRRAIYRYWRATERAGVDVCLLSLADHLATYGVRLDTTTWLAFLDLNRTLLESYFLHAAQDIEPPQLLSGQDLINHLNLSPGPLIGELLEQLREAHVLGEITTQEEALNWVQRFLQQKHNGS